MTYNYIFPTCIFSDNKIDFVESILPLAEEYITNCGKQFLGYAGHVSTYNNFDADNILQKDPRFNNFKEYIIEQGIAFLNYQGAESHRKLTPFLNINKMIGNSAHPAHTHPNSILSGILYLNINDTCAPITFKDPRGYCKVISYKQLSNNNTPCLNPTFTIKPQTGMILMWPAWLEHEVPVAEHATDSRITLVFNLGVI
jgi:uncharacterized protein (TIGR02466 family)